MRRRAWVALGLFLLGLTLGIVGRELPNRPAWNLVAGLLFLVAMVLWLTLLPLWHRMAPDPMPGLFARPSERERWCTRCGRPTAQNGPCRSCGATSASPGK